MDRTTFFGGSPLGVIVRLALISIVVGVILSALDINLRNFLDRINTLLRNLYDLGFGAVEWVLEYLVLGALVVVPIWIVVRLLAVARQPPDPPAPRA